MSTPDDFGRRGVNMDAILEGAPEIQDDISQVARLVKEGLVRFQKGTIPLKIPQFPRYPATMSPSLILYLFLETMMEDTWLRDNALIICFDTQRGDRGFGVGRLQDLGLWLSQAGKQHLGTSDVTWYMLSDYRDMIKTTLSVIPARA